MAGHHPGCPAPFDDCACAVLWAAEVDDPYGLGCTYGRFYDPDFDSDPFATPESYGGWSRTLPREVGHP